MMATAAAPTKPRKDLDHIEIYRQGEFEAMGFDLESAAEMAILRDFAKGGYVYDVHAVRKQLSDLMMKGCTAELAARIVL